MKIKPADLRAFAREWDGGCLIRIPGVCNWQPTCLCHYRVAGVAGAGQKPADLCGAIGCDACHAIIDRRVYDRRFNGETVALLMLEGLVRTLAEYSNRMVLVKGPD